MISDSTKSAFCRSMNPVRRRSPPSDSRISEVVGTPLRQFDRNALVGHREVTVELVEARLDADRRAHVAVIRDRLGELVQRKARSGDNVLGDNVAQVTGNGYDGSEGVTSQSRYTLFRPSDCPNDPVHLTETP